MGRLTDNILAVLGIKPSDRVDLTVESNVSSAQTSISLRPVESQRDTPIPTNLAQTSLTPENTENDTQEEAATVPAEPKDCITCKFVGTTVSFGIAAYIAYILKTGDMSKKFPAPKQQRLYKLYGYSLITMFSLFGIARAFDIGLFDKRPLTTVLNEEIGTIYTFFGQEPPVLFKNTEKDEEEANA